VGPRPCGSVAGSEDLTGGGRPAGALVAIISASVQAVIELVIRPAQLTSVPEVTWQVAVKPSLLFSVMEDALTNVTSPRWISFVRRAAAGLARYGLAVQQRPEAG
jgi:predicted nicotinamide N-methyase